MAGRRNRLSLIKRSAPLRFFSFGNYKKYKLTVDNRLKKAWRFSEKKPLTSFFIALGLLFLIIALGSTIFRTRVSEQKTTFTPKNVTIYSLGEVPSINVQATVKKSGVVTIVAQTPGIVSKIHVKEGSEIAKNKTILSLSSNYKGDNAPSVQRQVAGTMYKNTKETHDIQTVLIQRQRDFANRQSENSEELRRLTRISIDETRTLVNLNSEIIRSIQIAIQNAPPGSDISMLQQQQAQLQAGQNQLQSGLRMSEYQVDETRPIVDLERINRDIALAQLDLQQKALKFSLQSAALQLKLAQIQEANMFPSSPFPAIVQKIHVKVGESVNPGTPLATIAGFEGTIIIDAKVPKEIAQKVPLSKEATIVVADNTIKVTPFYVSTEATEGQLYSVLFSLDKSSTNLFTDSSYVTVSLPVGDATGGSIPFIPVDSVFQTQNEAYVYVVKDNKAVSKRVKLGQVIGSYVTVEEGLLPNDKVILNRNVVDGDQISIGR